MLWIWEEFQWQLSMLNRFQLYRHFGWWEKIICDYIAVKKKAYVADWSINVWYMSFFVERKNREITLSNYLSDILHVWPGVLLQQKELVPHPTSFGAPQWHSVGILSCQSYGPPPPPCSPSQGPESVSWRAGVDHGPQHHQYANVPSIHAHATTAFCLRPPQWSVSSSLWSEYRISPHAVIYWSRKGSSVSHRAATSTWNIYTEKTDCQYWEGRQQFVTKEVKTNLVEFQAFWSCSTVEIQSWW